MIRVRYINELRITSKMIYWNGWHVHQQVRSVWFGAELRLATEFCPELRAHIRRNTRTQALIHTKSSHDQMKLCGKTPDQNCSFLHKDHSMTIRNRKLNRKTVKIKLRNTSDTCCWIIDCMVTSSSRPQSFSAMIQSSSTLAIFRLLFSRCFSNGKPNSGFGTLNSAHWNKINKMQVIMYRMPKIYTISHHFTDIKLTMPKIIMPCHHNARI